MMMSLFWVFPLHVWLWETERKFTEEEQEEELLKISCKTKWSLWPKVDNQDFEAWKGWKSVYFCKTRRTLWELVLTILAKIFTTIKLLHKPYWVVELEDEEKLTRLIMLQMSLNYTLALLTSTLCKWKRQRNKTVAARRDERRVGSLSWNLPTYVPLPSAEISHEMMMMMLILFWNLPTYVPLQSTEISQEMMMMMLSLFCDTGQGRYLHLAKPWFAKKISKVSAANRLLSSTAHSAPPRSLARSLVLLRRSKSAAHVHRAQQSFVSVPHCQALDTLHSSVRSIL